MRGVWPALLSKQNATELPGKLAIESETEIKYFRGFNQNTGKMPIAFSHLSFKEFRTNIKLLNFATQKLSFVLEKQ